MKEEQPEEKVQVSPFVFEGDGGAEIHAVSWLPRRGKLRAVVIVNHGMAEHIRRYHDFASYLACQGLAVYGEDHRGHGKTAGASGEGQGYFARHDGWMKVISDIRWLYRKIAQEHPDLPVFMLGHSMGSFLTRHYLALYGEDLHGAVLLGTGSHSPLVLKMGKWMAGLESRILGKHHKSSFLHRLSFGAFNKAFQSPDATGFEWLSRDKASVQAYLDDSDCGFVCTSGFYRDLFQGLEAVNSDACFKMMPPQLPLLILSGSRDPVAGPQARGVRLVAERCRAAGLGDVSLVLKEDFRHECLHEQGREQVCEEILCWIIHRL